MAISVLFYPSAFLLPIHLFQNYLCWLNTTISQQSMLVTKTKSINYFNLNTCFIIQENPMRMFIDKIVEDSSSILIELSLIFDYTNISAQRDIIELDINLNSCVWLIVVLKWFFWKFDNGISKMSNLAADNSSQSQLVI